MTNQAPAHSRYTIVAIVLHWVVAAFLLFEVGLGLRMEAAHGSTKFAIFQLHKSIGITILMLVVLRLLWRFYRTPPAIVAKPWEKTLAHAVHWGFYLLLFALPLSGWIIISTSRIVVPTLLYGTVPWPHFPGLAGLAAGAKESWHDVAEFFHHNLVKLLYLLFVLHVAGALKHHFVDRDPDIAKMAPGTKAGSWTDPRLFLIALGVIAAAGLGLRWLPIGAPVATPVAEAPAVVPVEPVAPVNETAEAAPTSAAANESAPAAEATAEAEKAPLSTWAMAKSSTIHFRTSWSGEAINGGFNTFDGDILFSPDQLDKSKVEIRIDASSIYSGDDQRDETLKSSDWFYVSSFATAIFKAERFRKTGDGRYVASGSLKLKGVTLPISLPFTLKIDGNKATMQGNASIDRTAYKIGEGEYASTAEIPGAVAIDIKVSATRK